MKIEDIEIHTGTLEGEYKELGPIKAQVGAATAFSKAPTIEDVNFKLREKASQMGANAVIKVTYDRGIGLTSWKALTANGLAVIIQSDEKDCPYCAERIKKKAIKCKHCGADLPSNPNNSEKPVQLSGLKRKVNPKTAMKNFEPLKDEDSRPGI